MPLGQSRPIKWSCALRGAQGNGRCAARSGALPSGVGLGVVEHGGGIRAGPVVVRGAANRAVPAAKPSPPELDGSAPRVWGNVRAQGNGIPSLWRGRGAPPPPCARAAAWALFAPGAFVCHGPHSGGHLPVLQQKMGSLWLSIHSLC